MDEFGRRVETDTSELQLACCIAQAHQFQAAESNIDRVPEQVLAVFCDAGAVPAQHFVRLRRAIRGDDLPGIRVSGALLDLPENIHEAGIDICLLPVAPRVDPGTQVGPDRLVNTAGAFDRRDRVEAQRPQP